jgi:hypothetical protein
VEDFFLFQLPSLSLALSVSRNKESMDGDGQPYQWTCSSRYGHAQSFSDDHKNAHDDGADVFEPFRAADLRRGGLVLRIPSSKHPILRHSMAKHTGLAE